MTQRVKKEDLQHFAAAGYPADVPASDTVSSTELCRSVCRVLRAPTARLVQAASFALVEVARRGDLDLFDTLAMSDDARRRLGFLAERLSDHSEVPFRFSVRLKQFAERQKSRCESEAEPVALSGNPNQRKMELLERAASPLHRQWKVFGRLDLDQFNRIMNE